jgi:hypothetical protein
VSQEALISASESEHESSHEETRPATNPWPSITQSDDLIRAATNESQPSGIYGCRSSYRYGSSCGSSIGSTRSLSYSALPRISTPLRRPRRSNRRRHMLAGRQADATSRTDPEVSSERDEELRYTNLSPSVSPPITGDFSEGHTPSHRSFGTFDHELSIGEPEGLPNQPYSSYGSHNTQEGKGAIESWLACVESNAPFDENGRLVQSNADNAQQPLRYSVAAPARRTWFFRSHNVPTALGKVAEYFRRQTTRGIEVARMRATKTSGQSAHPNFTIFEALVELGCDGRSNF